MYRGGYVYILTNAHHNVFYVGMTSNLPRRIYEHKHRIYKNSHTDKYNIDILVYFEGYDNIAETIIAEKKRKKLSKPNKVKLIESVNPEWKDLYEETLDFMR